MPQDLSHVLAVAIVFVLLAAGSLRFTLNAFSASDADPAGGGYYQRLATSFLSGHLHLEEPPPPEVVNSPNPWDPEQFNKYRHYGVHDASLFRGRYFYYWGPSPVLLVVIPARLLGFTVTETDVGRASMVSLLAVAAGFALLVVRRFGLGPWTAAGLAVVAGTPFSAWFQLPRLAIYEANILFGAAAAGAAALCFLAGGRRLLFLGGVLATVAMTARLEAGVVALVPIALALPQSRRRELLRNVLLVGVPMTVGLGMLLLYNELRFGSPFEFGQKYVLAGIDLHRYPLTSVAYIPWSLRYYLFRETGFSLQFPYFNDPARFSGFPGGYLHFEPTYGAIWTIPATMVVLPLGIWLAIRRLKGQGSAAGKDASVDCPCPLAVGLWLLVAAFIALVLNAYGIFHASQRFRIVYDVLFVLGAVALIGAGLSSTRGPARSALRAALAVVIAASVMFALLGAAHGVYPDQPSVGRADVRRFTDWLRS